MTGRHSILLAAILWVHAKAASAVSCPEKRLVVNVGKAQVEVAVEGELWGNPGKSAFQLVIVVAVVSSDDTTEHLINEFVPQHFST